MGSVACCAFVPVARFFPVRQVDDERDNLKGGAVKVQFSVVDI